jgi:hypothetical protein
MPLRDRAASGSACATLRQRQRRELSGRRGTVESEDQPKDRFDLFHGQRLDASESAYEREGTTALTARQMARLGRSIPALAGISTRMADGACELDSGTTTIRSVEAPVVNSSTETTTAGRVLPGSPARAAPSATSQVSPQRGASVEAILEGGLPRADLGLGLWALSVDAPGLALRAPDGLAAMLVSDLGEQRSQR